MKPWLPPAQKRLTWRNITLDAACPKESNLAEYNPGCRLPKESYGGSSQGVPGSGAASWMGGGQGGGELLPLMFMDGGRDKGGECLMDDRGGGASCAASSVGGGR